MRLFGLIGSVIVAAGVSAGAQAPDGWQRGVALMKQKQFEAACPLLVRATDADPHNGALWSDLGLCEWKRGHRKTAEHALLLAVRWGDADARQHAYFNLQLMKETSRAQDECFTSTPPPELACQTTARVCEQTKIWGGSANQVVSYTYVVPCDSGRCPPDPVDDEGQLDLSEASGGVVRTAESVDFPAVRGAWVQDRSPVVRAWINQCVAATPGDAGETGRRSMCERQAQDRINRALEDAAVWPEVIGEKDNAEAVVSEGGTSEESCSIVVIDPCRNVAGLHCTQSETRGVKTTTKETVEEVRIAPPAQKE